MLIKYYFCVLSNLVLFSANYSTLQLHLSSYVIQNVANVAIVQTDGNIKYVNERGSPDEGSNHPKPQIRTTSGFFLNFKIPFLLLNFFFHLSYFHFDSFDLFSGLPFPQFLFKFVTSSYSKFALHLLNHCVFRCTRQSTSCTTD